MNYRLFFAKIPLLVFIIISQIVFTVSVKAGDLPQQYQANISKFIQWFHKEKAKEEMWLEEERADDERVFELTRKNNPEAVFELGASAKAYYQDHFDKIGDQTKWIYRFISEIDESRLTLGDWRRITAYLNDTDANKSLGVKFKFEGNRVQEALRAKLTRTARSPSIFVVTIGDADEDYTRKFLSQMEELSHEIPEILQGDSGLTCDKAAQIKSMKLSKCQFDEVIDSTTGLCTKPEITVESTPERYTFKVMVGKNKIGGADCKFSGNDHEQVAYIPDLYIQDSFQGQGLASRLMDEMIKKCSIDPSGKKSKHLYLDVKTENIPAIKLYFNKGFRIQSGSRGMFRMVYKVP